MELTVKPRGTIRWNITGANPKEGAVYTGPIDLPGEAEMTVYVYAEDQTVGAARSFIIPRIDQKGPTIIKTQPAHLRKKLDFRGSSDTYSALGDLEPVHATLSDVSLTVGEGAKAITTRFGSDIPLHGRDIRPFIDRAREILNDQKADVVLRVNDVAFASGHDLESFAEKQKLELATGDIDQ